MLTGEILALMSLKFRHAGQACITANRVYIQRGVYNKSADLMAQHVKQLRVGHGLDPQTTMSPLTVPARLRMLKSMELQC